jgi:glycerol uptake facilitator-like aquaporin
VLRRCGNEDGQVSLNDRDDGETTSASRRVAAEAVGSALLTATVVGSGVMAERLAGGNGAIALLANSLATGATLVALILTFGPISGAHFNPVVTCNAAFRGLIRWRRVPGVIVAQVAGALAGVLIAHVMFGEPLFAFSTHARAGAGQIVGEFVATFGLIAVIEGCSRRSDARVALAVAAYITAAYWFTSSTSFANPAITLARSVTNTFAGIRPIDAPAFIAAQIFGSASATVLFRWFAATPAEMSKARSSRAALPTED